MLHSDNLSRIVANAAKLADVQLFTIDDLPRLNSALLAVTSGGKDSVKFDLGTLSVTISAKAVIG